MSTWGTQDELSFITLLGTGAFTNIGDHDRITNNVLANRLRFLRGYQQSIRTRTDWDRVDPIEVEKHVTDLITRLSAQTKENK